MADTRHGNWERITRAREPMPDFVRRALEDNDLMDAYHARPPYQQNDYMGWINRAQLPRTKEKRLRQMVDELRGGTRYMNMAWRPRS